MTDSIVHAKAIAVQTQEEERYRLAHLLQAGPAQLLANATLEIETYLQLMETQPQTARAGLDSLLQELQQGLGSVRNLIASLHPPLLEEIGLVPGVNRYVDQFRRQTGIAVELIGWEQLTERLPDTVELAVFRIVQESLDNVRKHSQASHARVEFENKDGKMTVTIADNGRGFATTSLLPGRRLGLAMMYDRAELLEGTLQITSELGHGVRVVLTAPLHIPTLAA